jgi:hypothetical protein
MGPNMVENMENMVENMVEIMKPTKHAEKQKT